MMLGLLSDSHDNVPLVEQAAAFFRERRVDGVFHLGDVMDPSTLDALEGLPVTIVRGNNDEFPWPHTWREEIAGVRVGATHGHDRGALRGLVEECDVVLHGHTHARRHERVGTALVVNPGALYRTRTHTVALLELPSRTVVFYAVDADGVRRL